MHKQYRWRANFNIPWKLSSITVVSWITLKVSESNLKEFYITTYTFYGDCFHILNAWMNSHSVCFQMKYVSFFQTHYVWCFSDGLGETKEEIHPLGKTFIGTSTYLRWISTMRYMYMPCCTCTYILLSYTCTCCTYTLQGDGGALDLTHLAVWCFISLTSSPTSMVTWFLTQLVEQNTKVRSVCICVARFDIVVHICRNLYYVILYT